MPNFGLVFLAKFKIRMPDLFWLRILRMLLPVLFEISKEISAESREAVPSVTGVVAKSSVNGVEDVVV